MSEYYAKCTECDIIFKKTFPKHLQYLIIRALKRTGAVTKNGLIEFICPQCSKESSEKVNHDSRT